MATRPVATVPSVVRPFSDASLFLDFENGHFKWGDVAKSLTDLTVQSTGYALDDVSWFDPAHSTIMVEWITPDVISADMHLFSLGSDADAPGNRLEIQVSAGDPGQPFMYFNPANASYVPLLIVTGETDTPSMMGRRRMIFSLTDGATPLSGADGYDVGTAGGGATSTVIGTAAFTKAAVGFRSSFGDQFSPVLPKKVVAWSTAKTATECRAILEYGIRKPIHMLADSFGNGNPFSVGGGFTDRLRKLARARQYVCWSEDCAGGQTMTQHASRYAAHGSQHWSKNLLIFEGGLDGTGPQAVSAVQDMLSRCTGDYLIVEPVYAQDRPTGSSNRADLDAAVSVLRTFAGNHWVPTLAGMQAANNGSANDLADVANNIWPRSLQLEDGLHANGAGQDVLATIILPAMIARGWW